MARFSQTKSCQHLDQHMVTFTGAGFTCFVSLLDKKLASAFHRSETFNFDSLARAVQLQETILTAHFCLGPIPKVEGFCMIQLYSVCLNLFKVTCTVVITQLSFFSDTLDIRRFPYFWSWTTTVVGRADVMFFGIAQLCVERKIMRD